MNKLVSLLLLVLITIAVNCQVGINPLSEIDSKTARILLSNDFESGSSDPWYDNSPSTAHWFIEDFSEQSELNNPAPSPVSGKKYLRAIRDAQLASGLLILRTATFTALPGDQFSFQFWIRSRFTEGNNLEVYIISVRYLSAMNQKSFLCKNNSWF